MQQKTKFYIKTLANLYFKINYTLFGMSRETLEAQTVSCSCGHRILQGVR